MKIDSNVGVPLGWVLSGIGTTLAVTITGVFWVSAVNFRLQRIEQKLGIPPIQVSVSIVENAFAGAKKADKDGN